MGHGVIRFDERPSGKYNPDKTLKKLLNRLTGSSTGLSIVPPAGNLCRHGMRKQEGRGRTALPGKGGSQ